MKMRAAMKILYYMFLSSSALVMLVHGQPGFISIDCGIAEGSNYKDATTGILYDSDAKFVDTGINANISSDFLMSQPSLPLQLSNLRSFRDGDKNCYTLITGKGNKYLIRTSFLYGNYDAKDNPPEFELHLGVEEWDSVSTTSKIVRKEIIHVPLMDYVYVCLVNIGKGTPFISALELRELNSTLYSTSKPTESLLLNDRPDIGSVTNQTIRYPNDEYDRIWRPYNYSGWEPISAAYESDRLSGNEYKPPKAAMSTAVKPIDNGTAIRIRWGPDFSSKKFYVCFYFAEVEGLADGESRKFSISINDGILGGPYTPLFLQPTTVFIPYALSSDDGMIILIYMVEGSTLPPILNALEVFNVKEFLQSPTDEDDVNAVKKIKSVYKVERNWQGDPCVPTKYLWVGLNCSDNAYNPSNITSLDLSSSQLIGKIDSSFSNLKSLQYLDLSNNSLSGPVPDFLTQLPSLKTLNLSGNMLTGSVPPVLIERYLNGTLSLSLDKNQGLCWPDACKMNKKNFVVPIVASILSFFGLFGALAMLWILRRRRHEVVSKVNGDGSLYLKNRCFSYSEVVRITNDFQKVIGKGGSGTVYEGQLRDGTQVAVKMLSPSSTQGSRQFQTEAQLLTRVHHRNLALLVGYCDEGSNMGLIYEYMASGNLREHLSGAGRNTAVVTWEQRLCIAIDAAQAFEYLHNGCTPPIIHGDVKTANILLNEKLEAKVADFGLSRILPFESGTQESITAVASTLGYLDPEYYISNRLNEKSDVYSFGIVLLELITGQPAILKSHNNTRIVQWINPILERRDIGSIVDPTLRQEFEINSVWKAVETAMACVSSFIQRPNMSQVLEELKECLEMEIARESSWISRENQETTSSTSFDTVPLVIEPSEHLKEESVTIRDRRYTFSEVVDIIGNVRNYIGEGGFGKVYKGKLKSGKAVAVKINSAASTQGLRELQAEVNVLMRIHHRNLVRLYGYSDEGAKNALLYEYMENGNLRKHLSETNSSILSWRRRLQIALDTARGLNYLHNDCTPAIIHRDLKPTNILLDENWQAKIADFGLSRVFAVEKDTHVSTRVAGTFGYIDPELFRVPNNAFRKTSDVYSFGIILLELITGKTAVMNNPSVHDDVDKINKRDWVEPKIAGGDATSCADPKLAGNFNPNSVTKAAELAKACTGPAQDRPDMREVERRLEDCLASELGREITQGMEIDSTTSSKTPVDTSQFEASTSIASSDLSIDVNHLI